MVCKDVHLFCYGKLLIRSKLTTYGLANLLPLGKELFAAHNRTYLNYFTLAPGKVK